MPWRLIIFIVISAIFLVFISFNLENRCDINFGFTKLSEVPVFITIFTSFILGLLCALPLMLHIKMRSEALKKEKKLTKDDTGITAAGSYDDKRTGVKNTKIGGHVE